MGEENQTACGQGYANSGFYKTAEFTKIRKEYEEGLFKQEESDLEAYVRGHRNDILDLKFHLEVQFHQQFDVINVLKMYIAKTKTINPMHELEKEKQEIFRECYFRWRNTNIHQDAVKVAMDWARLHAPGWRDHEVHGYIFLVDQKPDPYRKILENSSKSNNETTGLRGRCDKQNFRL